MKPEEIEAFLISKDCLHAGYTKISFRQREPMYGLFVKDADYSELKGKNFWRVVPQSQLDTFKNTGDMHLARIFNGADFAALMAYEDSFE